MRLYIKNENSFRSWADKIVRHVKGTNLVKEFEEELERIDKRVERSLEVVVSREED